MTDVFFLDPDYAGEYDSKNSFNTMRLKPDTLDLFVFEEVYLLIFITVILIILIALTVILMLSPYIQSSALNQDESLLLIISAFLFSTFLIVVYLGDAISYLKKRKKYNALIDHGIVLDGELIEADHFTSYGDTSPFLTVTYTFVTPKNQELICTQRKTRGDLLDRKVPRKGTSVKVLYANDNACVML